MLVILKIHSILSILGWCISSCGFLNNLSLCNQTITINCIFSSIIHDCLRTFGQVSDPTLEEIRWFGLEEFVEPILERSVVVEGNSTQTVGEKVGRWYSDGARSGEYDGCGRISQPSSRMAAFVVFAV
jgi:hypothetical protein